MLIQQKFFGSICRSPSIDSGTDFTKKLLLKCHWGDVFEQWHDKQVIYIIVQNQDEYNNNIKHSISREKFYSEPEIEP